MIDYPNPPYSDTQDLLILIGKAGGSPKQPLPDGGWVMTPSLIAALFPSAKLMEVCLELSKDGLMTSFRDTSIQKVSTDWEHCLVHGIYRKEPLPSPLSRVQLTFLLPIKLAFRPLLNLVRRSGRVKSDYSLG